MESKKSLSDRADVIVVGGGLAGLVATHELLGRGKKVLLLERGLEENLGGLAKDSFGGVLLVGTKHQARTGIEDSEELALADWLRYGEIKGGWPQRWAEFYIEHSIDMIYEWLDDKGVSFLPVVNWPERGMHVKGNSVPRWHIAWGTGFRIIKNTLASLFSHPQKKNLFLKTQHKVENFIFSEGKVKGVVGKKFSQAGEEDFEVYADAVVLACGGICGGDLSFLKSSWPSSLSSFPKNILNGSHPYADGLLHSKSEELGASLTNLEKHWHYAAGIHHPTKTPNVRNKGLSLVPPRSALWLNARGERIGPDPLVGYIDTSFLVEKILKEPGQYSWQVMNWKMAIAELAVSGCQYMTSFLKESRLLLLRDLIFGNRSLVNRLIRESEDVLVADSLEELAKKMKDKTPSEEISFDKKAFFHSIRSYDKLVEEGDFKDFQLQKIREFKNYKGDRLRIASSQKIENERARPYIAIKECILTRKSLGGIKTNLSCEVIRDDETKVPGLYAIGEAAGFGGGGIHGKRSLEGTFLGSCLLTGQQLARSL